MDNSQQWIYAFSSTRNPGIVKLTQSKETTTIPIIWSIIIGIIITMNDRFNFTRYLQPVFVD